MHTLPKVKMNICSTENVSILTLKGGVVSGLVKGEAWGQRSAESGVRNKK